MKYNFAVTVDRTVRISGIELKTIPKIHKFYGLVANLWCHSHFGLPKSVCAAMHRTTGA